MINHFFFFLAALRSRNRLRASDIPESSFRRTNLVGSCSGSGSGLASRRRLTSLPLSSSTWTFRMSARGCLSQLCCTADTCRIKALEVISKSEKTTHAGLSCSCITWQRNAQHSAGHSAGAADQAPLTMGGRAQAARSLGLLFCSMQTWHHLLAPVWPR